MCALKRQQRWLSQQRISVPSIRALEASVASDFDSVLRDFMAGTTTAYLLKGFSINIGVSSFSQSADNLTVNTLNAAILHTLAIESGTLLKITGSATEALNTSNSRVSGSFVAGSANYISINFIRKADTSTDTSYFYDKNSETEFSKLLPQATLLDYKIIINITGFGNNVPVAIVTTSASNVATQIVDSRQLFFRLGSGGTNPDAFNSYPWSQGRTEPGIITTSSATDPFTGADKNINVFKDWLDAVMTTLKEIKGTSYWYSLGSGGSSSGLSLLSVNDDANLSTWTGAGNIIHNLSITGQLISDDNLFIRNFVTDSNFRVQTFTKSLSDGDVLFLNLSRYIDVTGNVTIDPPGTLPGSLVGLNTKVIQASVVGQLASLTYGSGTFGDWIKSKNDNARYFRQIDSFYTAAGSVTTSASGATYLLLDSAYNIAGATTGAQQVHYNKGNYSASDIVTSSKVNILSIYNSQNVYWLGYRDSDKLYVRNMGRFVAGEKRPVNENTSANILNFIGSANESLTFPIYASSAVGAITTSSQVNYSGTSTDNLTVRTSILSTAMADKAQDKNITLMGGGTLDNTSGLITWNASVTVAIGGPGTGNVNYIPAGNANLNADNSCAYVTIDRNVVSSLAVSVTTFANLPLTENTYVIARKLTGGDVWVGVGGQAYLISDGTNSLSGFSPTSPSSLGLANLHKWRQEIPIGAINSINTSFTITNVPHSVTALMVFKNGLFQSQGPSSLTYDYSLTNSTNIVFYTAPTTGDEVVATFARGNNVPYVYVQSLTSIINNLSTMAFSPSPACSFTPGVAVFLNGLQRSINTDFTASASGIGFTFILAENDIVSCFYAGVNDNEIALQSIVNETVTSGRTIYTYNNDYHHAEGALLSIDGVAQFPVNNTYGLTSSSITVNDYRILNYPSVFEVNAASLTLGSVIYFWSK